MNRAVFIVVLLAVVAGFAWWANDSYTTAVDRAEKAETTASALRS